MKSLGGDGHPTAGGRTEKVGPVVDPDRDLSPLGDSTAGASASRALDQAGIDAPVDRPPLSVVVLPQIGVATQGCRGDLIDDKP